MNLGYNTTKPNDQNKSIFQKKSFERKKTEKPHNVDSLTDSDDNDDSQVILSYQDIIKNIPKEATSQPNHILQKTHTEWRWRFFDLKGRKLVEISKIDPMKDRTYMDNTGKWIKYTLVDEWDEYVVESKYCYILNN
jgi:hypothetical protein